MQPPPGSLCLLAFAAMIAATGCGGKTTSSSSGGGPVATLKVAKDTQGDSGLVYRGNVTRETLADLKNHNGIRQLTFQECSGFADGALAELAAARSLHSLSFQQSPLQDAALADVAKIDGLVSLKLINTRVEGPGLAHLKSVKRLTLQGGSASAAHSAGIGGLSQLEGLDLSFFELGDFHFSDLKLAHLRELTIRSPSINDKHLADLPSSSALEQLLIPQGEKITDAGVAKLDRFPRLQAVDLTGSQVTNAALQKLGTLSHLQQISLLECGKISADGLRHLANLKHLKSLTLTRSGVKAGSLKFLAGMKSLKHIQLWVDQVSKDDLAVFKQVRPDCVVEILRPAPGA